MSTTNEALDTEWEKVAEDTDSLMLTIIGDSPVEVAFMDTDVAPTDLTGHLLLPNRDGLLRTLSSSNCPPGFVYAKTATGSSTSSLAIDTWTE